MKKNIPRSKDRFSVIRLNGSKKKIDAPYSTVIPPNRRYGSTFTLPSSEILINTP